MRVVIDTNILIGGAYDENSYSYKIIREVISGRLMAFATHKTMRENKTLLGQAVTDSNYRELLESYFRRLQIVRRKERLDVISDKEDNKLFESAVAADADFLITNDREVLDVEEFAGAAVVTPEEFWTKYKAKSEPEDKPWRDWINQVMGG